MNDEIFGPHARALALRAQRAELLAANLANADTPNYKARDIDFAGVLGAESSAASRVRDVHVERTSDAHLGGGARAGGFADVTLKYRVPHQPSLDGNTVDEQVEKAEFAANSVRYLASLQFLDNKVSGLIRTLRGE